MSDGKKSCAEDAEQEAWERAVKRAKAIKPETLAHFIGNMRDHLRTMQNDNLPHWLYVKVKTIAEQLDRLEGTA